MDPTICKLPNGRILYGCKMKLYPGYEEEYEKRHNQLWPEMKQGLHDYGAHNYTIFLDDELSLLFGYIEVDDVEEFNKFGETEICQKWWDYMADIMETNDDNSPVLHDLHCAFHLD